IGKLLAGIGMDRSKEDVATVIEDRLRSIAVVIVHVQHRKLGGPLVAPSLGSDGRIVEEAVAAVVVRGCMVPWWTTEGEDSAPSLSQLLQAGQGDIYRGGHSPPGAGGDRRAGIEGIIGKLAIDDFRFAIAHAAHRPIQGKGIMASPTLCPEVPGLLKEVHVPGIVDPHDRLFAEIPRGEDFSQTYLLNPRADHLRSAWHLEAGHQATIDKFGLAVLQAMILAVDRQHRSSSQEDELSPRLGQRSLASPSITRARLAS